MLFEQPDRTTLEADIYAFGQYLEILLPGHRLAAQCMSPDKSSRPDCFDLVLEELEEFAAVRTWIGSALIAVCTSLLLFEVAAGHPLS